MAFYTGLVLVFVLVVSSALTYLAVHFGWSVDSVSSGSMEPSLSTGSVVVTRPIDLGAIQIGDVITFHDNSPAKSLFTHRVVGISSDNPSYFKTKGDACLTPDRHIVSGQNIVGKVCFSLPLVGYIIQFLKSPSGFFVAFVLPTIILVLIYIRCLLQEVRKYKKHKSEQVVGK